MTILVRVLVQLWHNHQRMKRYKAAADWYAKYMDR